MYLPQLGWETITEEQLFSVLPEDKADMNKNLQAILELLSPIATEEISSDTPSEEMAAQTGMSPQEASKVIQADSNITENDAELLENTNEYSKNQSEIVHDEEIEDRYGEEETE
jgi:hypothetical protein